MIVKCQDGALLNLEHIREIGLVEDGDETPGVWAFWGEGDDCRPLFEGAKHECALVLEWIERDLEASDVVFCDVAEAVGERVAA